MATQRRRAAAAVTSLVFATTGLAAVAISSAGASGAVTFGTLASPCGHATGSLSNPGSGVTSSSIKIGYGDDGGFAQTNIQMGESIEKMIAWCNSQGGIDGRTITGDYLDAKLTSARAAVDQGVSDGDFMLVGEGWADDGSTEADRLAANLVSVPGFTASASAENAYEMYQPIPNPANTFNDEMAYIGKSVFGSSAVAHTCAYRQDDLPGGAALAETIKEEATFGAAGWTFMNSGGTGAKSTVPDGTVGSDLGCDQDISYLSYIANSSAINTASLGFKAAGAKVIVFQATPGGNLTDILTDDAANHYNPVWLANTSAYAPSLAKWNKKGYGNNFYVELQIEPLEATGVPAVKAYEKIVPAADQSPLGEQAADSFLLWATAAKSCGSNLTRQCVVNYLGTSSNFSGSKAWTGGGLNAPSNPATNTPSDCALFMKLTGTKWTQASSGSLGHFTCAPAALVNMTSYLSKLPGGTLFNPAEGITLNGSNHFTGDLTSGQSVIAPGGTVVPVS